MSVAPMLRATVLGYADTMDAVVEDLQRAGVLQIDAREYESDEVRRVHVHSDDERLRKLDEQVADAQFVTDFLSRFHTADHAFSTFVSEKIHIERADYESLQFDDEFRRIYRDCEVLADRIASHERERDRLHALVADLTPWRDFGLKVSEWKGTEKTALFTGTVPTALGEQIRESLRQAVPDVTVEELGPIDDRQAWVVIVYKDKVDEVRTVLMATEFAEVSFPKLTGLPSDEIATAEARIGEIEDEQRRAHERAVKLAADFYPRSVAVLQAVESERDGLLVRRKFARTERVFAIDGWVAAKRRSEVEAALSGYEDSLELTLEEPDPEDEPPVELENPRWIRPFEILTDLYGRPRYRDADPTPILTPFFLLFFSICIGDVGYGLLLLIGAWLIKTKLDVAPGVKRFMDLLMLGGLGSMVVGVLLGGYFAIPAEALPEPLLRLRVLDPIGQIQSFLLVALLIGVVQVFFGVLVAAWHSYRRGDTASAIGDHLSIVFLFAMLAGASAAGVAGESGLVRAFLVIGLIGTVVLQGRAVQAALGGISGSGRVPSWDRALGAFWSLAFVGGIFGFAFQGMAPWLWIMLGASALLVVSKSVRAGVLGVLAGAYNVYGLTSVVGDVLSYLRLAALGLSSGLVGWVFNILTELVWDAAAPMFSAGGLSLVFGVLIAAAAVAVFAVGHVFNVVINLLGAFVHPARLQFVEFFSKFYEAGGQPYTPFALRKENLVLGASRADGEGGGS